MKKLLVGLGVAALSAAMCMSFAACGGGVDAEGIKGEEVTEEQWTKAFEEIDKVTDGEAKITVLAQMTSESEMDAGELGSYSASGEMEVTYVINGKLVSKKGSQKVSYSGDVPDEIKNEAGDVDYEAYSETTDDGTTVYTLKDGKWSKAAGSPLYYEISDVLRYADDFADFEYNADFKGYVAKGTKSDAEKYTVLKFQDGKLVAIYSYEGHKTTPEEEQLGMKSSVEIKKGYVISYEADTITIPDAAKK